MCARSEALSADESSRRGCFHAWCTEKKKKKKLTLKLLENPNPKAKRGGETPAAVEVGSGESDEKTNK